MNLGKILVTGAAVAGGIALAKLAEAHATDGQIAGQPAGLAAGVALLAIGYAAKQPLVMIAGAGALAPAIADKVTESISPSTSVAGMPYVGQLPSGGMMYQLPPGYSPQGAYRQAAGVAGLV